MAITKSGAKRRHNTRTVLAAMVSVASVALLPGHAVAASKSTTQKQASLLQKSSAARSTRRKAASSGSPYVCMPSGFGRKGRCVLRASLR
jgi:formate hydrogenlyase subunit 3/multisubunit Na+/H+ antiporter MnhD subunit